MGLSAVQCHETVSSKVLWDIQQCNVGRMLAVQRSENVSTVLWDCQQYNVERMSVAQLSENAISSVGRLSVPHCSLTVIST